MRLLLPAVQPQLPVAQALQLPVVRAMTGQLWWPDEADWNMNHRAMTKYLNAVKAVGYRRTAPS